MVFVSQENGLTRRRDLSEMLLFVMCMCWRRDEASFGAVIDGDGEVTDFLRLPHVMKRRGGWNRDDAELKVTNIWGSLSRSQSVI